MAKIVSFIGAKGGTLKTASVAAVSHVLARAGLRVVMVDLDPQGDLTNRSGSSRVLDPLAEPAVPVQFEGAPTLPLWLLRGGRSMESATEKAIRVHLARARELDPDVIVVDTAPAMGPSTRAAALMADFVWIPSEPGKESLTRAHDVLSILEEADAPPVVRILITKANPQTRLFRWMIANVDEFYPSLRSPIVIPHETAAAESAVFDQPVTLAVPKSNSALAYCDVAAEILRRLKLERRANHVVGAA